MLIQLAIVLVAVGMIVSVWRKERQGALAHVGALGWTALWLAVLAVALRPELASQVAAFVGVGRGADVALYAAVIILFALVFRLVLRIERMERDLTSLVRARALDERRTESAGD